jgi:uncharacterized membrane protein YbhN (UPF0104 family)
VERVLDGLVSAVLIVTALSAGLLPNGVLQTRLAALRPLITHPFVIGLAAGGAALTVAVGVWLLRHRLVSGGRQVMRGLVVLGQPRRYLASVASWQLLAWVLRYFALVLFLQAFHVPEAAMVAPVVLSLQLLAGWVPLTPGGVGTQQVLIAASFGSGATLGFSAGCQAATMLVDLLLGLIALACWRVRPQVSKLRAAGVPA